MKSVILTEKPSVARDLAGVLGNFKKQDGYLEGSAYIITWAIGHLVELAHPEDYDPQLKKWNLAVLPILPDSFKLKVNPKTGKQFTIVRRLLHRKDVAEIICATDAGREGELIFRYIYRLAGCRKPFVRLWLSETTPAAVQRAFADLRPGDQFNSLAAAAEARSQADWLIGINATRAFTVKYSALLSVGRVQTPTLALIVQREWEIKNFKPELYWEIKARFTKNDGQSYWGKWFKGEVDRFANPEAAREVVKRVADRPGVVTGVEEKEIVEAPPLLFNLNDLQKEANKKYGLPAARTLEVAQELYENKKLLTYPRTDSRHLTREMAGTIPVRLAALARASEYAEFAVAAQSAGMPGRRYVDDGKVTDHTALIPTAITPILDKLTTDQRHIYDMVARRFLAVFFSAARYRQTRVVTESAGETFLTTGRVELEPGWKAVYVQVEQSAPVGKEAKDEDKDDTVNALLPPLARGENVQTDEVKIQEKKTRPPKRYTDAGILAAMEGAGRFIDDRELKEAMQGHGLGTPATRAAIIERLIQVGYIKRHKKSLMPTDKGETLIGLVPDIIKDPALTGHWEKNLADIEAGAADVEEFMDGIVELTKSIVSLTRNQHTGNQQHLDHNCVPASCNHMSNTNSRESAAKQTQPDVNQIHYSDSSEPVSKKGHHAEDHGHFSRDSLGTCPLCGRAVVENPKGYGCTGYREGCSFVIWKEIAGKKISRPRAKTLLTKGRTGLIKGFTARKGTKFDAVLALSNGRVEFQFGAGGDKQSIGRCPLCGREVVENSKGYGCTGYKAGCKMVIWKQIAGRQISPEQARELLEKGKTGLLGGFTSRAGKPFDAALMLDSDGQVKFDFQGGGRK